LTSRNAVTAVPLHPLLAGRWSPRAFDRGHELADADLVALLEAARWAPSGFNGQPWRFLAGRRGDPTFKGIHQALRPSNQRWAGQSSALLVGLARVRAADGTPARLGPYELGLAVGQLVVQASAAGLHVHQMAGFDGEAVRDEFGVPPEYEPFVVIAVGRLGDPADLPEELRVRELADRVRHPLDELAYAETWGRPAGLRP
jgi:nitroreductase